MSTADAREEPLKLMGVGRKVVDCILLMSLDKVKDERPFSYGSNCLFRLRPFLWTRTFSRLQQSTTGTVAYLGQSRRCLPSCRGDK